MYDPTAWSRIPEFGKDMARGGYHQPNFLLPTIQGFTSSGDSVLEVACGAQGYAHQFRSSGLKYVGLDVTPEYLELARKNYPELKFVEGDARKMPFEDKSFVASFCNNLLLHLTTEDAEKVFHEMLRVTKKAVLIVSMFGEEDELATKKSTYPEADGICKDFLHNRFAYSRFLADGWVTYVGSYTSILLVSSDVKVAMNERD